MNRDPRILLEDIEQASARIERYTQGMDLWACLDDERTQDAVERNFEIVGEALNRLHHTSPELSEKIPRLRKIVNFRNHLIHGFDDVDIEASKSTGFHKAFFCP